MRADCEGWEAKHVLSAPLWPTQEATLGREIVLQVLKDRRENDRVLSNIPKLAWNSAADLGIVESSGITAAVLSYPAIAYCKPSRSCSRFESVSKRAHRNHRELHNMLWTGPAPALSFRASA